MADEFTENVLKLIEKDFGKGLALNGSEFSNKKFRIIPVSPSFNLVTGGIPEGSWVTFSGKPKTGKTTTALHFAGKCQLPKYGSKHVYYLNVEGRLKEMNLYGIDRDKFTVIESTEDKILSAQDYLNIAEKILYNHKECVMIIDSYSMLCHEKEHQEGVGTFTRGGSAALLAQFCRQMAAVVPVKRSIVIGITQLMANTSGYGSAIQEKGGNAVQYQVDVKARIKSIEPWEEDGKRVGQAVTWDIECSALGLPPGQQCVSFVRYGRGIDEVKECIELGCDLGLIRQAGKFFYLDFMQAHIQDIGIEEWNEETKKSFRAEGKEKLYNLLRNNPGWMASLEKDVAMMLGIK